MATLKDYETIVKKISSTPPDKRAELVREKAAISDSLRKAQAGKHDATRKLKFAQDEINAEHAR